MDNLIPGAQRRVPSYLRERRRVTEGSRQAMYDQCVLDIVKGP